jgi:hypothetical protein
MNLTLNRLSLENVEDAAGRWQFEGGEVFLDGQQIGNYASTKRIVLRGTEAQNTAMLTITLFFLGSAPPENLTLQGAHDFNSGGQSGSVSAASSLLAVHLGRPFTRIGDILTINE